MWHPEGNGHHTISFLSKNSWWDIGLLIKSKEDYITGRGIQPVIKMSFVDEQNCAGNEEEEWSGQKSFGGCHERKMEKMSTALERDEIGIYGTTVNGNTMSGGDFLNGRRQFLGSSMSNKSDMSLQHEERSGCGHLDDFTDKDVELSKLGSRATSEEDVGLAQSCSDCIADRLSAPTQGCSKTNSMDRQSSEQLRQRRQTGNISKLSKHVKLKSEFDTCGEFSWGLCQVLVTLTLFVGCGTAFNVDTRTAVVQSGPEGSMFGFSVAQHKDQSQNW